MQWPSRAHRFLTGREAGGVKPVFGLTASIMIRVASVGYARPPEFEVQPPGAPRLEARLAWALLSRPEFWEAYRKEGMRVDWERLRRLTGVKQGVEERKGKGKRKRSEREKEKSKL